MVVDLAACSNTCLLTVSKRAGISTKHITSSSPFTFAATKAVVLAPPLAFNDSAVSADNLALPPAPAPAPAPAAEVTSPLSFKKPLTGRTKVVWLNQALTRFHSDDLPTTSTCSVTVSQTAGTAMICLPAGLIITLSVAVFNEPGTTSMRLPAGRSTTCSVTVL